MEAYNRNGKLLNRFPVAAYMAFANAGATGGTPGSPAPTIFSPPGTILTPSHAILLLYARRLKRHPPYFLPGEPRFTVNCAPIVLKKVTMNRL